MPFLEVKTPQGLKRFDLSESAVTVGRHPENTLHPDDDLLSRRHCVVEAYGDGFRVRDLGSRNGTKVNSLRVTEELLFNGDVIVAGQTEMNFVDPEQRTVGRRRDTPDYAEAALVQSRAAVQSPTIDVDTFEPLENVQTSYEKRLRDVIDSSPDRTFEEADIALVDNRGVTVHQATAQGLSDGSGDDVGESIRAFRLLLLAAFRARATDLHLEPRTDRAVIRMRVDGFMISAVELSTPIFKRIVGMVKILCQIDTTQKNAVQDGHFSVSVKGRRVDYRVSLTPAVHGQKMVVRVLDSSNAPSRLHELGLLPWMYDKLRSIATKDAGMLLACGPTGSGKTTTLYSCLREIDVEQRNAITIEDPVEYFLEGCTQIPIDHKIGNTFGTILRSVLRQDPDVIFVGEIRDIETATVAMQAAMTGHLVYSTVHAKDSIGAIFRLLDLGVEAYLVANALNLILAQRLVRLICETCRKPVRPTPAQNMRMGKVLDGVPRIFVPVGCKHCLGTGFHGRRALFEMLEFSDAMRDIVLKTPTIAAIREVCHSGLFTSLATYGYTLVAQGITSIEEVDRVATSE
ncbi:MAG TPA: ATPase, T2SS/T4P/T4SS family [Phycisphaerales bacterium]|nr:ATPase, T2SS/T4P/T4SS family [Phycisphaerales bacterium]HMP36759.1 ATPase, T2SS/T4P/T4SS family [Phycisphaerales bacterium]